MNTKLKRELGVPGAVALGLGSMVGTGVFVALGLGAGVAGAGVLVAIVLAGFLALCNALSSAQLAAAHPVAGGTYEYGHEFLTPALGAVAGVTFLVAKSASAATAALGLAAYGLSWLGVNEPGFRVGVGIIILLGVMSIVLEGLRRTTTVNTVIVMVTLLGLLAFVAAVAWAFRIAPGSSPLDGVACWADQMEPEHADGPFTTWGGLAMATALVFVAYTGYGRIATCAEEVRNPATTIPIAVFITMLVTIGLYSLVTFTALLAVSPQQFAELSADGGSPLVVIADRLGTPSLWTLLIAVTAITAMFGVLLNLVFGLSRVALAMGRRGHFPRVFAKVDDTGTTPAPAVLLVTAIIAVLIAVGSIQHAWSLSAVTVLIYYGLTNAAALRLPTEARRFPRVLAWIGLLGCFGLSFTLEPVYVLIGFGFVVAALLLHAATASVRNKPTE
ncbi:MAG: APC family permease [Planctomycetota bacterium]